jgi:hypothetical protein
MVFSKTPESVPGCFEQHGINRIRLLQAQTIEVIWQSEDHVIVRYIEQLSFPFLDPLFALMALALRTMSVPAAVVAKVKLSTIRVVAAINMSS